MWRHLNCQVISSCHQAIGSHLAAMDQVFFSSLYLSHQRWNGQGLWCVLTGVDAVLQDRRERRRRDRNSLRGIWQGIWRNHPEQEHASSSGSPGSGASSARPAGQRHPFAEAGAAQQHRASPSLEAAGSRLQSPFTTTETQLPDYQVRLSAPSVLDRLGKGTAVAASGHGTAWQRDAHW